MSVEHTRALFLSHAFEKPHKKSRENKEPVQKTVTESLRKCFQFFKQACEKPQKEILRRLL
jgi:hypothetical protein